jgi:hypothetical protein
MRAVDATVSENALAGSLPHRSEEERQEMARSFRSVLQPEILKGRSVDVHAVLV